jgi:hypothetical protein
MRLSSDAFDDEGKQLLGPRQFLAATPGDQLTRGLAHNKIKKAAGIFALRPAGFKLNARSADPGLSEY